MDRLDLAGAVACQVKRVVPEDGALIQRFLAFEQGQKGTAVHRLVFWQLGAGDLGEGGEEIHAGQRRVAAGAGLDDPGPGDAGGDPDAAFEERALGAAQGFHGRHRGAAVVR